MADTKYWVAALLITLLILIMIIYSLYPKSSSTPRRTTTSTPPTTPNFQITQISSIDSDGNQYLGKQVMIEGGLENSRNISSPFKYLIQDSQGYWIYIQLPQNNNRQWFLDYDYNITGTVETESTLSCNDCSPGSWHLVNSSAYGLYCSNGSAAQCFPQNIPIYYILVTNASVS